MEFTRSYKSIIVGLSTVLVILVIAFATIVTVSQPQATTVAYAESSSNVFRPLSDASAENTASGDADADSTTTDASAVSDLSNMDSDSAGELATSFSVSTEDLAPELTPAERVNDSARYLAAYLAQGRYLGLPGAQELYEPMLEDLGIDFTDYDDIVAEVEAVTAALEAAPDLWHSYADATIAAGILPA